MDASQSAAGALKRKASNERSHVMVLSAFGFSLMSLCVKQLGGRIPVAEGGLYPGVDQLGVELVGDPTPGRDPWGNRRPC